MKNFKLNIDFTINNRPALSEKGFTLIELIIAMAVASIVALSGFALFSTNNWSYQIQEDVGEAQQNGRIALDRIARDIRGSGFGLSESDLPLTIGDSGELSAPITVTDGGATGRDEIIILGIGYEEGVLVEPNENKQEYICYQSTSGSKIFDSDSKKVLAARKYISIDGIVFAELDTTVVASTSTCGVSDEGTQLPLGSPSKLPAKIESGTVYILQAIRYKIIDTTPDSEPPCTTESPCLKSLDYTGLRAANNQVVAENIDDLQFAYGIDVNSDGIMDDNADGVAGYAATDFLDDPPDDKYIVAVRASISAKTRRRDPKGLSFTPPALENKTAGAADRYRRRVFTRLIKMRNIIFE